MNIIVGGSRTFANKELLFRVMDKLTENLKGVVIFSGGAKGADKLGEEWAFQRLKPYRVYRAEWDKHGKAAGPIRNKEMLTDAAGLVAFWDGSSPGTADMIKQAKRKGIKVKVVRYKDE